MKTASLYPSDLYEVRSKVREYARCAKVGVEIRRQAERIAVRTMCKGISANQALTNARVHIWNVSQHV